MKVCNAQELLGVWALPFVRNSKYKKIQRFGNWICFHPQVKIVNKSQRLVLSEGSNRVVVFLCLIIARVFRRDSPPTRSRRSTGSGEESSSMLTSVEGNAVQGRMLL
jgi:hypothetical protein